MKIARTIVHGQGHTFVACRRLVEARAWFRVEHSPRDPYPDRWIISTLDGEGHQTMLLEVLGDNAGFDTVTEE